MSDSPSSGFNTNKRELYNSNNYNKNKNNDFLANSNNDKNAAAIGELAFNAVSDLSTFLVNPPIRNETQRYLPVAAALNKMQRDMEMLDDAAGKTPQLSSIELAALFASVLISFVSPALFSMKVVEVLIPSMAALSASIGISAEYVGKVAVANGKEIAALAIEATAESEACLAQAERINAVLPLCVGIATTASAFALLAPSFVEEISHKYNFTLISELYLVCPLVAVLAAAVAGLATQESKGLASKAIGVGNRRFASSKSVGRTWMSSTEQVAQQSSRTTDKWVTFAFGVLPGPIFATLCPGSLGFKSIVGAAIAAAQAAYYLAVCEYALACAVDAVALKARSAAVADTYANQGSRAGSILPFTSALAGLCAAASAAAAELLPLVSVVELQALIAVIFPSGAALFAAAAAVSKARCEVDAAAASEAAATGLSGDNVSTYKDPREALIEIITLTINTTWVGFKMNSKKFKNIVVKGLLWSKVKKWVLKNIFGRKQAVISTVVVAK